MRRFDSDPDVKFNTSKAVHRARARRAQVVLPQLKGYERKPANGKVVKLREAKGRLGKILDPSCPDAWRSRST